MIANLAALIVVTAVNQDYREVPVSLVIPAENVGGIPGLTRVEGEESPPCQVAEIDGQQRLCWIERNLKKGETRRYRLSWAMGREAQPEKDVAVHETNLEAGEGDNTEKTVEVKIRGELFTRYRYDGQPKPYCYPLLGPTGRPVTRGFPMEQIDGESKDHKHHRSAFWFTHDEVNGQRFWTEGSKGAKQIHQKFETLSSGPALGVIRARNNWVGNDDTKVCEDVRELRIHNTTNGRLVDFEITVEATDGDVTFGDTKEGSFGFRVAHTMKLDGGGKGHIENAAGDKDRATWGKAAEWCDYYGPVGDSEVGIAIMDSPKNFRHPTHWHVRSYGLFAANPFGLRHFTGDKTGKGKHTIPKGESLTFRYRVWIHEGSTADANVAQAFAEYASPPKVVWARAK